MNKGSLTGQIGFTLFIPLLCPFVLVTILSAKTLNVPQSYTTIQSAVNASSPRDTVIIDEGRYFESIHISKNIIVGSRYILDGDRSHIVRTIIDGSKATDPLKASTVTIRGQTDTTCMLMGLTIQGGHGTYDHVPGDLFSDHWVGGGGICLQNAGARIAHNFIRGNALIAPDSGTFVFGAGIATVDASNKKPLPPFLIIEHNIVDGNTCSGHLSEASGIWVGQPAAVRNNVIVNNRAFSRSRSYGGGLYVSLTGEYDIAVEGNYISGNTASIGGGVLVTCAFVRRGRAVFTNNIIAGNEAFEVGGAVNVAEESYAVFVNNTIVRNKAMSSGGGINVTFGAHAVLANNIIWNNTIDQVSMWGAVQCSHNAIEGDFPGKDNISADPEFLRDDSLFRLSPNSPCLSTGTSSFRIGGVPYIIPKQDQAGSVRALPSGTAPDIGAMESPFGAGAVSRQIIEDRKNRSDQQIKLTVLFHQQSPAERNPESHEIRRAGRMSTTIILNDSVPPSFRDASEEMQITLPPGNNFVEVEVIGRSMNASKGINVYFWLEGSDPQVSMLSRRWQSMYHYYAGLNPGSYRLVFQPQDQENFIGHTNRIAVRIIVLPYWYQRWWTYSLFAIVVLGAAFSLYRTRMNRLVLEQQVVSERLHTEKLDELNQMKSQFFANVSHELRTPLSLIIGPVNALLTHRTDTESQEQLGLIQRNAQRLLRLIELLLQFSRMESGTLRLNVFPQDAVELLRRITGYFSSPASQKRITIQFTADEERIPGMIDAEKIEHIFQNCLSNSLKFTPPGGTIQVRVRRKESMLVFSVSDTGVGIPAEHLPHVFERFYRIDPTHKTEGTGIGLSLSKELTEIHHGSMSIKSEAGKGTIVTVRIPLTGYDASETAPAADRYYDRKDTFRPPEAPDAVLTQTGSSNDEQPIILIAEDNEDARLFIRTQLEKSYTILLAEDGSEALEITKHQIPDLVISDVMMPKLNGHELCRELKKDERTSHIPVILLTALAEQDDKLEGLDTGADDYLVKPFDAEELRTRVQNILENRLRLREAYSRTANLSPGEVSVHSLDDVFLKRTIGIVNKHMSDPEFSVERLAHENFLSRTQLQRKLKALTNLAPSDFIRHLRLLRAKELLEKNAGTIAEIADSVGFTNHSYFAKCFQEQFALLPNQVRNHQK